MTEQSIWKELDVPQVKVTVCKCGGSMNHPGGFFPRSPTQNAVCTECGSHCYNGRWFTKAEWLEWVEDEDAP